MYVGPWQEFKLMKVIADVKAENTRLKQSSLRSLDAQHDAGSSVSTPKSFGAASINSGVSTEYSRRPLQQQREGRRGNPGEQVGRANSRPLSRSKPESVASNRSAPVMPTIPGVSLPVGGRSGGGLPLLGGSSKASVASTLDVQLQNTFMNFDTDYIAGHPMVSDLIRGGPASTFQQASMAGQRTHFPPPPTQEAIAARAMEEELRAKQRRQYLATLYSGESASPTVQSGSSTAYNPATGAGGATTLIVSSSSPVARGGSGRRAPQAPPLPPSGGSGVKPSVAPAGTTAAGGGGESLLNKNVLRDLRAFYDVAAPSPMGGGHAQQHPLPPPSSALLPWDVGLFQGMAGGGGFGGSMGPPPPAPPRPQAHPHYASPAVPAPLNIAALLSQRSSSGAPSVSSVGASGDTMQLQQQYQPTQQQQQQLLLGGGDAQRHHLRQRPYDYGGPPAAELLPTTTAVSSSSIAAGGPRVLPPSLRQALEQLPTPPDSLADKPHTSSPYLPQWMPAAAATGFDARNAASPLQLSSSSQPIPDMLGHSPTRDRQQQQQQLVKGRRAAGGASVAGASSSSSSGQALLFPIALPADPAVVTETTPRPRPQAPGVGGSSALRSSGNTFLLGSYGSVGSDIGLLGGTVGSLSSPKSQPRASGLRGGGGRPASGESVASLDGDEMAALLSWANNLNPRDAFGL